jgi:ankyrin repeat protein
MSHDALTDEVGGDLCFDVAKTKAQYLEKEFRKWDANFNLGIDEFEWDEYIEKMVKLVGKQTLHSVLDALLLQRTNLKEKNTIDGRCMSERLLEKAINVQFVGKSQAEQVCGFLNKGADPNYTDAAGASVLCHLASKCEPSLMGKLLACGGNATQNTNEFDSAVLVAARARRMEVLRVLVLNKQSSNRDANFQQVDDDLSSRLVVEVHMLQEKQIRELVSKGADINFRNIQGWIPLTSAVFWGRRDIVELLIRLPIADPRLRLNVDIPNLKGRTALHVAVRKGKFDLIPLLVGARADVNALDLEGWTPMHHAVFNSRSEAVSLLYSHGAKVNVRSYRGITPFMLASSCDRVTVPLTQEAMRLLQPPECVRFADVILPILKDDALLPYEKVTALMDLPGVYGVVQNLRLHDQLFRMLRGPNKVQVNKLWDLLCCEILKRLRSENVDLEPLGPRCHDAAAADFREETKRRLEKQQKFIAGWLEETAGPPKSSEWAWDNREGYREKLMECVKAEMEGFKAQISAVYDHLSEQPGGAEVIALPRSEVVQPQYMTQQGAHPILKWVDCADAIEAFAALCDVKAFGNNGDDNEAITGFMELISAHTDFMTGSGFWQNVYKLWLSNYARLARPNFYVKLQKFIDEFNLKNQQEGLEASLSEVHSKTYEEMKADEHEFGTPGYRTHDERVVASKALDVISSCIIANNPAAVVQLVYALRQLSLVDDKLELVQIQNGFHIDAESCNGLREVLVNVVFKGGHCHGHGAREGRSVSVLLVAQLRIVLPQIASARQGMKLLSEFMDGKFDPQVKG